MAQPDWSAALPGNLSRKAVEDLVRILRRSGREFCVAIARQSRERLIARIRAIETGAANRPSSCGRTESTPNSIPQRGAVGDLLQSEHAARLSDRARSEGFP